MKKFNATPLLLPHKPEFKTGGKTLSIFIKSGSDVSIEASGEVILDKGFEVEAGASFEISFTNLN